MGHHLTSKSGYQSLVTRLNYSPQGAPSSESLYKIFEILFSQKEALLLSRLPLKPFTAGMAAGIWKMGLSEARKILDRLASRALLVDFKKNDDYLYVLPPPMAGFFEFSLMRTRKDIDQKLLSELFYQYLNVEEDFVKELFTRGDTQLGRTFVNEPALSDENALHVLSYERATEVINSACHMGISTCYCRHKMQHVGRNCDAPMEICMTFNTSAQSLIRHGHAREVEAAEGLELLQQAYEHKLVQFGENVRENVNFICNCCGCCCEAMIAARKFAFLAPVHTTYFIPVIEEEPCNGCGKCVQICPVEAMILVSANDPANPKAKKAKLDKERCLGCGLCVGECRESLIALAPRAKRVITPLNVAHRTVVMAIERQKLQHFIFDNKTLLSHRALAAVLGVILKLPPFKQIAANKQLQSRYLETLIRKKFG